MRQGRSNFHPHASAISVRQPGAVAPVPPGILAQRAAVSAMRREEAQRERSKRRYKRIGQERRQDVYQAIREYKAEHSGKSPTLRELCDLCGVTTVSVMNYILHRLQDQGAICLSGESQSRGIEIVGEQYTLPAEVDIR